MPVLIYNFTWMSYNCILAVLAVIFGIEFLSAKKVIGKVIFGILWLLFLPNTIYIFTDMIHLFNQWGNTTLLIKVILLFQYTLLEIICFVTYIYSFQPFEILMKEWNIRKRDKILAIVFFNFLIAFGMVLGRVERLNSWDVFTNPDKVIASGITTLTNFDHLALLVLFGLFCNFFYFLFRNPIYRIINKCIKLIAM